MIRPRSDWGARPRLSVSPLLTPAWLDVHWEGSTVGLRGPHEVPAQINAVQRFHMDSRGMSDIAYNFLIDPFGETWEGRGKGVRSGANGTDESNKHDYAVCVLVGVGDPPPGPAVFAALAALRDELQLPLRGHRDVKPTACPGDDIYAWVKANSAPTAPVVVAPIVSEEDDMVTHPNVMLRDERDGAIWAIFSSGKVLHLGGAAYRFYAEAGVKLVTCDPAEDHAEADRLRAMAG